MSKGYLAAQAWLDKRKKVTVPQLLMLLKRIEWLLPLFILKHTWRRLQSIA
jgi:hypothetical protein